MDMVEEKYERTTEHNMYGSWIVEWTMDMILINYNRINNMLWNNILICTLEQKIMDTYNFQRNDTLLTKTEWTK